MALGSSDKKLQVAKLHIDLSPISIKKSLWISAGGFFSTTQSAHDFTTWYENLWFRAKMIHYQIQRDGLKHYFTQMTLEIS